MQTYRTERCVLDLGAASTTLRQLWVGENPAPIHRTHGREAEIKHAGRQVGQKNYNADGAAGMASWIGISIAS